MKLDNLRAEASLSILAHFLETGKPATCTDIAERIGINASAIGRAFESGHFIGCDTTEIDRPIIERSYGSVTGHRSVMAWVPSRAMLRKEVLAAREAAKR